MQNVQELFLEILMLISPFYYSRLSREWRRFIRRHAHFSANRACEIANFLVWQYCPVSYIFYIYISSLFYKKIIADFVWRTRSKTDKIYIFVLNPLFYLNILICRIIRGIDLYKKKIMQFYLKRNWSLSFLLITS